MNALPMLEYSMWNVLVIVMFIGFLMTIGIWITLQFKWLQRDDPISTLVFLIFFYSH